MKVRGSSEKLQKSASMEAYIECFDRFDNDAVSASKQLTTTDVFIKKTEETTE